MDSNSSIPVYIVVNPWHRLHVCDVAIAIESKCSTQFLLTSIKILLFPSNNTLAHVTRFRQEQVRVYIICVCYLWDFLFALRRPREFTLYLHYISKGALYTLIYIPKISQMFSRYSSMKSSPWCYSWLQCLARPYTQHYCLHIHRQCSQHGFLASRVLWTGWFARMRLLPLSVDLVVLLLEVVYIPITGDHTW